MKVLSFISLDLPLLLKIALSGHAKLISEQDKLQIIRWYPPENYHLTLVFSGDIESVKISALQFALERKMESAKAVPLIIYAITPFLFSRPRIAAVLFEHTSELLQLQSDVADCMRKYGITTEHRCFIAHVTLGRLK